MKKRIMALVLLLAILMPMLLACSDKKTVYDNEASPLVLSSSDLDGVFNPFFATSGPDMEIVGMTQLSMMTNDRKGELVCGENEATVALDYKESQIDNRPNKLIKDDFDNYYTNCEILIKNGLKFSDGTPLTIKDVLFNLYVFLDPVYTGSATIYSTDIKGLKAYRSGTYDEYQYEHAEAMFKLDGQFRMDNVYSWATSPSSVTGDELKQVTEDLKTIESHFFDELTLDWSVAASMHEEYKEYAELTETWQFFMVLYGYIELETESGKPKVIKNTSLDASFGSDFAGKTDEEIKEICVNYVYRDMITLPKSVTNNKGYRDNIALIVSRSRTAETALDYFVADEKSKYFDENRGNVPNISGITVSQVSEFNGKTLDSKHYVLKIVVNGVDPKAKYNFAFSVAPMKHYSTEALYKAAMDDLDKNPATPHLKDFGVLCGSLEFMFDTVRDGQKVPIGAGPYQASSVNNETTIAVKNEKNKFFSNNVVYFIRNDNFIWPAKIKLVRYKVISSALLYNAVDEGEVHLAMPNAKMSTINSVRQSSHLDYLSINTLGYGYVGINAKYVKDIRVRRAIMHAIDTAMTVTDYYTSELASPIYRSMTTESWAYPTGETAAYPFDPTGNASMNALESAYTKGADGILWDGTNPDSKLKFTFTIAGEDTDHPIYNVFYKAKKILESKGFSITVTNDSQALKKLASGLLTVWAAAWGSTLDPDMYQVYHMDSMATSVLNWGYKEILKDNSRTYEQSIVKALSEKIDEGRRYLDRDTRADIYHEALDLVMDLAIELPTYQRKTLYVFNKNVIDVSTMAQETSSFYGPLMRIWELSLVTA